MSWLVALCLLLVQSEVHGFKIIGNSMTHQKITERAILNATVRVCRTLAVADGKGFTSPPQPFTPESVAAACEARKSSKSFRKTIKRIQKKNWLTDIFKVFDPKSHCDDEQLTEGQKIITDGLSTIKAANQVQSFTSATSILGKILHTLQDFYSHSNWVELRNQVPNSNLIKPKANIGKIADKTRATCRNCDGDDCTNNILEGILEEKILTSGYFSILPFKPAGKCSHGNFPDTTSLFEPKGGINKDTPTSSHGHLHFEAVNLAIAATSELLEDVRGAAGDKQFLQMMGISKGTALCFVIDTTGSMSDDIAAVRTVTASIIDSKVGTEDEPSSYILVPFNDPDFGPLTRTTDPELFKKSINSLPATGGGDFPEMSLSALQLALTGTPSNSEIFVFTDATAKDGHLRNPVIALIEQSKSVVNFMITGILGSRRRRQASNDPQQQHSHRMVRSDVQLYRDLSQASGGQAIEVSKDKLLEAISIITQSTSSAQVTLLQAARSTGKAENFTFTVDESVKNLTIYITGISVDFTLINPSGVIQSTTNTTGSSIITVKSVGNFHSLQLQTEVGMWEIRMDSTNPYTLKVIGESLIDFLFDFVKMSQGPFEGFVLEENRPSAGVNGTLMVTLIGGDSATVTEVTLVESSGSGQINGSVESQGGGEFFARFDEIPSFEFVVLVKGQKNSSITRASPEIFQRQSPTRLRASTLSVSSTDSDSVLEPGSPFQVHFSVMTSGTGGNFTIQATNDQTFPLSFSSVLFLDNGGSANGTMNITAPLSTRSGTGVTLTIEATSPAGTDSNYEVLRFTVLKPVTDFLQPECQLLSLQSNCSETCSQSMWELSVLVSDGSNGTGIDSVRLREGNGTLNTSMTADNNTLVNYTSSCCSPDVQLVTVDRVGNVESCSYSVRTTTTQDVTTNSPQDGITNSPQDATPAAASSSTRAVQSSFLCLGIAVLVLTLMSETEII
ncbi:von Willebrand factor A domain-containing protein 7-like [Cololabis saira]|uniref:von Willebrand factor A domain-containing protein 7-like n=1 Tax=Cololabis saira TaxID=129043 RepID=UPI002AD1F6B5|nr:von Willebrand factor A domain-containing protein 7-like [Cololabis saira]